MSVLVQNMFMESATLGPGHTCSIHFVVPTSLINGYSATAADAWLASEEAHADPYRQAQVEVTRHCAFCATRFAERCRVFMGVRIIGGTLGDGTRACHAMTTQLCEPCGFEVVGATRNPITCAPDLRQNDILLKYARKALEMGVDPLVALQVVQDLEYDAMLAEFNGIHGHRYCFKCRAKPERPLSQCSRCRMVLYCSTECQRSDWAAHKPTCAEHQRERLIWFPAKARGARNTPPPTAAAAAAATEDGDKSE